MTASTTLMVPERHFTRIQGLNQGMQGLLTIVAAPLGALLLAVFPMTGVMMVDVGTALLAILPLLAIHVPRPTRSDGPGPGSVWAETAAGFRYLARRRGHATLVAMSALINVFLVPAFSLLPLLVLQRLNGGAAEFGWLSSSLGVGLIVGGAALGAWGSTERPRAEPRAPFSGLRRSDRGWILPGLPGWEASPRSTSESQTAPAVLRSRACPP